MKNKIYKFLNNKTVLITGGTGSFGKHCLNTLINKYNLKKIIIFSRDENKQFNLSQKINNKKIRFFLGDVRDKERLMLAFNEVDFVIHAAAQKHVSISEYNPMEAIKTNIIGTKNVIECAIQKKVKKIIMLSTDKAVDPINLYGSTKLCAEKLMVSANNLTGKQKTFFSVCRYGNVFNSRGSVLELYLKLKSENKSIFPLTNQNMTRFFISIDESVDFVLEMLTQMKGGEIFVPKMKAYKIEDIIKTIQKKAVCKIIGIRPGEKIHEILISDEEAKRTKKLKKYFIIYPGISIQNYNYKKNIKSSKEYMRYDSQNYASKFSKKLFKNFIQNFL